MAQADRPDGCSARAAFEPPPFARLDPLRSSPNRDRRCAETASGRHAPGLEFGQRGLRRDEPRPSLCARKCPEPFEHLDAFEHLLRDWHDRPIPDRRFEEPLCQILSTSLTGATGDPGGPLRLAEGPPLALRERPELRNGGRVVASLRSEFQPSHVDFVSTRVETDEQAGATRITSLFGLVESAHDPADHKERAQAQLARDVTALRWPLIIPHTEALYGCVRGAGSAHISGSPRAKLGELPSGLTHRATGFFVQRLGG